MKLLDALQIVLELANDNKLNDREIESEPQLRSEQKRQQTACTMVANFMRRL